MVLEESLQTKLIHKKHLILAALVDRSARVPPPLQLRNHHLGRRLNKFGIGLRLRKQGDGIRKLLNVDLQHARRRLRGELEEDLLAPLRLVRVEPSHELDKLRELDDAAAVQVDLFQETLHLLHGPRETKPAEHLPHLQCVQGPLFQPPLLQEGLLQFRELRLRETLGAAVGAQEGAELFKREPLFALALPQVIEDFVHRVLRDMVAQVRQCQAKVLAWQPRGVFGRVPRHRPNHVCNLRLAQEPDNLYQVSGVHTTTSFRVHLVAELPDLV
mmetsp:Transcript_82229/g.228189  ORF Transcript_82229/g.228189 Transcript_82229/m.228189 type:complete len:272 (-) Transcript_82229:1336-2151(-)